MSGPYNPFYNLRNVPERQRLSAEKRRKLEIAQFELVQQTPPECNLIEIQEIYTDQKVIANSLSIGGDIYEKYKIIMKDDLLRVDRNRNSLLSSLRQMLIEELTASLPDEDSEDGFINKLVETLVTSTSQVYIQELDQSHSGVQRGGWIGEGFLKSCIDNTNFAQGLNGVLDKATQVLTLLTPSGEPVDYGLRIPDNIYNPLANAASSLLPSNEQVNYGLGISNEIYNPLANAASSLLPSAYQLDVGLADAARGWTPAPSYGYGMSPATNLFGENVTQTLLGTPVSDIADFISANVTPSHITDFAVGTAAAQAPHIGLDLLGRAFPQIAPATKVASNAISTAQYAQSAYALSTAITGWSMLAVSGVAAGVFLTWWLIKKSKLKKLKVLPADIKSIEQNLISNLKNNATVNEKSLDDLLEKEIAAIETVVPAKLVEGAPSPCISEDGIKTLSETAVKNVKAKKDKKVKAGPANKNKSVNKRNTGPPTILGSVKRTPLDPTTVQKIVGPGVTVSKKRNRGGSAKTRKNKKKTNKKLNNNKKKTRRRRVP
jgi:hypothetical protein